MIISDASDEGADVRGAGTGTASASALRRAFSICSVDDDGRASKIECARAIRRQTGNLEVAAKIAGQPNMRLTLQDLLQIQGHINDAEGAGSDSGWESSSEVGEDLARDESHQRRPSRLATLLDSGGPPLGEMRSQDHVQDAPLDIGRRVSVLEESGRRRVGTICARHGQKYDVDLDDGNELVGVSRQELRPLHIADVQNDRRASMEAPYEEMSPGHTPQQKPKWGILKTMFKRKGNGTSLGSAHNTGEGFSSPDLSPMGRSPTHSAHGFSDSLRSSSPSPGAAGRRTKKSSGFGRGIMQRLSRSASLSRPQRRSTKNPEPGTPSAQGTGQRGVSVPTSTRSEPRARGANGLGAVMRMGLSRSLSASPHRRASMEEPYEDMSPALASFSSGDQESMDNESLDVSPAPSPWGRKFEWDYAEPQPLPEAVESYIGARVTMERRMSATGPRRLPDTAALAPSGKRRGSMSFSKVISSGMQATEINLPFTEAMFKAGVSETPHSTKQGIVVEGTLQKYAPEGMAGRRWHKRYFALYAATCELRYYLGCIESSWGVIPIGERGCIPLRLVTRIDMPSKGKWKGCRFDLVVRYKGEGRYPGIFIRPGHESNVFTTKIFKLHAPDPQTRLLWVTMIESLMQRHGWGLDTSQRRRSSAISRSPSLSPSAAALRITSNTELPPPFSLGGKQHALSFHEDNEPMSGDEYGEEDDSGGGYAPHNDGNVPHRESSPRPISPTAAAIKVPFSPAGKRGSLTVQALVSPAVPHASSNRRRSAESSMRV